MHATRSTTRPHRLLRSVAIAGLSLSLVAGVAACGDDDDDTAEAATTTQVRDDPTTDPATEGPATEDPGSIPGVGGRDYVGNPESTLEDAPCEAYVDFNAAFAEMPEDPGAIGGYFDAELAPHLQTMVDELDGDTSAAARTVLDTWRQMASSGDLSAMDSPALAQAQADLGGELHIGCDWEAITLQADEYVFEQAPSELPAGRFSFALENVGVEDHEMVLLRRKDGVTESFEELSAQGEAMMEQLEFTGVAFGGPGTTAYSALDLEPGTYFLVCFIPVGGGEDGPPHFMEGMQHTLEVY